LGEGSGPLAVPVLDSRDLAYAHHQLQELYGRSELVPLGGRRGSTPG
jgi:hypothetical protein